MGKSFARHQIRKMMGLLMMVLRRRIPEELIPASLQDVTSVKVTSNVIDRADTSCQVHTPLAPAECLHFSHAEFIGIYKGALEVQFSTCHYSFNLFTMVPSKFMVISNQL